MKLDDASARLNEAKAMGKFYTPEPVARLTIELAILTLPEDLRRKPRRRLWGRRVYDPACGAGSMLCYATEYFKDSSFYGQELDPASAALARQNLADRRVAFSIEEGDTLAAPYPWDVRFDVIVANPPFSVKWEPIKDDHRFPILAPRKAGDWAFVQHALYWLADDGVAASVMFPGALYRGNAERKIREDLVRKNLVSAVVQLPAGLFRETSIATSIVVFKRSKDVLFVDATELEREKVVELVRRRENVEFTARLATLDELERNDFNLSVSTYVEPRDTREKIDLDQLEREIEEHRRRADELRREIDVLLPDVKAAIAVIHGAPK